MEHTEPKILGKWNFIFLLGESGGGKGTLVGNIKQSWIPGLEAVSMGDIFREKAKTDPTIKQLIEQGTLVSDHMAVEIFGEFASNHNPGLIDGFPRNRQQTLDSIKFIKEKGWRVLVIDLQCDIEVIIERLLARGRVDDKLSILYQRNLSHRTLHPAVMEEIKSRPDLFDVIVLNGNSTIEKTYNLFLMDVLRQVDMLYLYDMKDLSASFRVHDNETNVNFALNRGLCDMLKSIQAEIDRQK